MTNNLFNENKTKIIHQQEIHSLLGAVVLLSTTPNLQVHLQIQSVVQM